MNGTEVNNIGDCVSWQTVNGVVHGTVTDLDINYVIKLENGRYVVVNSKSIIKEFK